jgi:tRNA A-37 threonylcarbamoyl transferase component Bud32
MDMADLVGTYLGRIHLTERLGEGGMATVYKGYDTRLGRDVAVKILNKSAFPTGMLERVLKRFEREAKSLAKLSHPNIVKVYDYGEHEGSPYLVMEYLPGSSLKKFIGKPVPWQGALRLLLPIARGVAYAHRRGVLHRDIKPANILIGGGGEPMLLDFGIAELFEEDPTTTFSELGTAIGTPEYMAPEQWYGKASPQSDLYSLGIVLYEMVAGRKPYVAETPLEIPLKQATQPLPDPRNFAVALPEKLASVLNKTLAKEPEDRYKDVNAFVDALEDLELSVPFAPPPLPSAPPPPPMMAKDDGETAEWPAHEKAPRGAKEKRPADAEERTRVVIGAREPRRVLNLNFSVPDHGHVLARDENLRPGRAYDLLVDVGLPWDKVPSLVRGGAAFPEDTDVPFLSQQDRSRGRFDIEVVFVSEDFLPHLTRARARLRTGTMTRSKPFVGRRLGSPGPVRLRVWPVRRNELGLRYRAQGRLCLYYGAQVLQSAVVDVGVSEEIRFQKGQENFVEVDFVLTPDLQEVGRNLSLRQRSLREGQITEAPVKLGLMINGDVAGTHRILLNVDHKATKERQLPPAWKAYDTGAIREMLDKARHILANPSGKEPDYDSDTFLLDKFKEDLIALAKLGAELHSVLLQGLTPERSMSPMAWRRQFHGALRPGDVIQLCRAGSVPPHISSPGPWSMTIPSSQPGVTLPSNSVASSMSNGMLTG